MAKGAEKSQTGGNQLKLCKGYFKLRVLLDALELSALTKYLDKNLSDSERERLLAYLENNIKPILAHLRSPRAMDDCSPMKNCCGCCVPYDCPFCDG
jgi:hypothetical protein